MLDYPFFRDGTVLQGYISVGRDVEIPDGITEITQEVFYSNDRIRQVVIPDSVTVIADSAFNCCGNLEAVVLPNGLRRIERFTFANCRKLSDIDLPEGLEYIGRDAFSNTALVDVEIPDSVTEIGDRAFKTHGTLESITIPAGVTKIGQNAVSGAEDLTIYTVRGSAADQYARENGIDCVYIDDVSGDSETPREDFELDGTVIRKYIGTGSVVVIPQGITGIGEMAFGNNKNISRVVIPDSVTRIEKKAFWFCGNLESVVLPKGLKRLEDHTFNNCASLSSILLPQGLESIGESVFTGNALTEVVIPDTVQSIGKWAFSGCGKLVSITIPGSVVFLGNYAFFLSKQVTIRTPRGSMADWFAQEHGIPCAYIQGKAYTGPLKLRPGDTPLRSFDLEGTVIRKFVGLEEDVVIPEGITGIMSGAFRGKRNLRSVTIPDTVTRIPEQAFESCVNLERVVLPDTVTVIGERAFRCCYQLLQIRLPASLKKIGRLAFWLCTSLNTLVIPDNGVLVCRKAFRDCENLKYLTAPGTTRFEGDGRVGNAFEGCPALTVHTNRGSEAERYSTVARIPTGFIDGLDIDDQYAEDFVIEGTVLRKFTGFRWYVSIPNGVTEIAADAFRDNTTMRSLYIPGSVTRIGCHAFWNCKALESVQLSQGLKVLGAGAFRWCGRLREIDLPKGLTHIGAEAFAGTDLLDISIPETVVSIGDMAFSCCKSLRAVRIPGRVAQFGAGVFYGCDCVNLFTPTGAPAEDYAVKNRLSVKHNMKPDFWARRRFQSVKVPPMPETVRREFYEKLSPEGKQAYQMILDGLDKMAPMINLSKLWLRQSELLSVLAAVEHDNPQIFWVNWSYSQSKCALKFEPVYWLSKEERNRRQDELEQAKLRFLTGISDRMDDYRKALLICQRMVRELDYDSLALDRQKKRNQDRGTASMGNDPPDDLRTVYGALVQKKAVCAGYAVGYQYLLQQAGIESLLVTSWDPDGGSGHAWTLAKLEGDWYHIDVTWSDYSNTKAERNSHDHSYAYFGLTDREMERVWGLNYKHLLPRCTETKCNFFVREGMDFDRYDRDVILERLEQLLKDPNCSYLGLRFSDDRAYREASSHLLYGGGFENLLKTSGRSGSFSQCGAGVFGTIEIMF